MIPEMTMAITASAEASPKFKLTKAVARCRAERPSSPGRGRLRRREDDVERLGEGIDRAKGGRHGDHRQDGGERQMPEFLPRAGAVELGRSNCVGSIDMIAA